MDSTCLQDIRNAQFASYQKDILGCLGGQFLRSFCKVHFYTSMDRPQFGLLSLVLLPLFERGLSVKTHHVVQTMQCPWDPVIRGVYHRPRKRLITRVKSWVTEKRAGNLEFPAFLQPSNYTLERKDTNKATFLLRGTNRVCHKQINAHGQRSWTQLNAKVGRHQV